MSLEVMCRVSMRAFTTTQFHPYVDYDVYKKGWLRMAMMYSMKGGVMKNNGGTYRYDPDNSWRKPDGDDMPGWIEVVSTNGSVIRIMKEDCKQCLIYICPIRMHPALDKSIWKPKVNFDYAAILGIQTFTLLNDIRMDSLDRLKDTEKWDFFKDPTDVLDFSKMLHYLKEKGYDEEKPDAIMNMQELCDMMVLYLNRYLTVIVGTSQVMVAEKKMEYLNGRPRVIFDLKRVKEFHQRHINKTIWIQDTKRRRKSDQVEAINQSVTRIWEASPLRSEHESVVYNPFPKGHIQAAKNNVLNMFTNSVISMKEVESCEASPLPWLDLLYRLVNDVDIYYGMLNFFAHIIHLPYVKLGIIPDLFGPQGNGKTLLIMVFGWALGTNFLLSSDITNVMHSDLLKNILLVYFDEAATLSKEGKQFLKSLSVNKGRTLYIKTLYKDPEMYENCLNIIQTSNHKEAFDKERGDRRHFLVRTDHIYRWKNFRQKKDYFTKFTHWYEDNEYAGAKAVAKYLLGYVSTMKEVFNYGPFEDNTNPLEDDIQRDLVAGPMLGYIIAICNRGYNFFIKDIATWKTLEQLHYPGRDQTMNRYYTGTREGTALTDQEMLEWDSIGNSRDMSVERTNHPDIWKVQNMIWCRFIPENLIYEDFTNWCGTTGHKKVPPLNKLKSALIEHNVGETSTGWRQRYTQYTLIERKKDGPKDELATQKQGNIFGFYPPGMVKKEVASVLQGNNYEEPTAKVRPKVDEYLSKITSHDMPYFMWNDFDNDNTQLDSEDSQVMASQEVNNPATDVDRMYKCESCKLWSSEITHPPVVSDSLHYCSEECAHGGDYGGSSSDEEEPLY